MRFNAAEVVDNSRKSAPHFGQVSLLSGAWVWHSEQVCTVYLLEHFFNFTTEKNRGCRLMKQLALSASCFLD
jgi:hypothetical protein